MHPSCHYRFYACTGRLDWVISVKQPKKQDCVESRDKQYELLCPGRGQRFPCRGVFSASLHWPWSQLFSGHHVLPHLVFLENNHHICPLGKTFLSLPCWTWGSRSRTLGPFAPGWLHCPLDWMSMPISIVSTFPFACLMPSISRKSRKVLATWLCVWCVSWRATVCVKY